MCCLTPISVECLYVTGGLFDILKLKEIASNFSLFLIRFAIFRRMLDVEMKDGTRAGIGLKAKQKKKSQPLMKKGSCGKVEYLVWRQLNLC